MIAPTSPVKIQLKRCLFTSFAGIRFFIIFFLHTEKYFRNLIKSSRNQILFITIQLILNQTDVHLVPNQSENGKYNPTSADSTRE